jgi:hypothetical protein
VRGDAAGFVPDVAEVVGEWFDDEDEEPQRHAKANQPGEREITWPPSRDRPSGEPTRDEEQWTQREDRGEEDRDGGNGDQNADDVSSSS